MKHDRLQRILTLAEKDKPMSNTVPLPETDPRTKEIIVETRTMLLAHLTECGKRYEALADGMRDGNEALNERLNALMKGIVTTALTLFVGLFSIIGILLHNGGHF